MIKVGILGAGPATQAIHLPTLARFDQDVVVSQVMDPDQDLATEVAEQVGARPTASVAELFADPPEVVVIASPDRYHAEQVVAACEAGARGILLEKPLATTLPDAERVAGAVRASGAALVVGAMHAHDPVWVEVAGQLRRVGPWHVRSVVRLPANSRFEEMAATMVRAESPTPAPDTEKQRLRAGILGLAIHDLPLIRNFLPVLETVGFAACVRPWGYLITATGPDGSLELIARTGGVWRPEWSLTLWSAGLEVELAFPPSYVHAGSATATLRTGPRATMLGPLPGDGYEAEWRELLAILAGAPARYPLEQLLDDLAYALRLAELAVAALASAREAA